MAVAAVAVATSEPDAALPQLRADPESQQRLEDLVREVLPAVVVLETTVGSGSGFFVRPGLLITNRHVIAGEYDVSVKTSDGKSHKAKVYGMAKDFDLALVRIDGAPPPYPTLGLASASEVRVGQEVVAVGSPLGLQNTVTRGIVSAIRTENGVTLVQSDAAINPGNSGGPLLDRFGRVIGVNTSVMKIGLNSFLAVGESLGFAISSDHARALLEGRAAVTAEAPASERDPLASWAAAGQRPQPPSEMPSSNELLRAQAEQAFEQNMRVLESRANKIDDAWSRYEAQCPASGVESRTAQRGWFGVWSAPADHLASPDGCGMLLREIQRRAEQIRQVMQRLEDEARRGGVLPGRQREIRSFHRLDW